MAIDTENKRRSTSGFFLFNINPVPDGTIDSYDRQHAAGLYSGIAAQSLLRLIKVFMFRDSGTPKTGLSPIVDIFVKALDGSSAGSVPTVTELSGGYYKFHHNVIQDTVVRVDSADVMMSDADRYNDVGIITPYDDVMNPPGIADAVWDEDLTGHTTSKTAGWFVQKIKAIVDAILGILQ